MNKRVKTVHINTEISNNLQFISGAKLLNNQFEDNHGSNMVDHMVLWEDTSLKCGVIGVIILSYLARW